MNPVLDEKYIVSLSASIMEIFHDRMSLSIDREAYGPTLNEGLCYEYCLKYNFSGKETGSIFFGMDGYTKILMLPYIAKSFRLKKIHPEVVEDALLSFFHEIAALLQIEIVEFESNFKLKKPSDISTKVQRLPTFKYRKYMLIFFLKDPDKRKYLGRLYCNLVFEKVPD